MRIVRARVRLAPCGCGKRRFSGQPEAFAAALRVSKYVGPLRVYECPRKAGSYHLTRLREWKGPK